MDKRKIYDSVLEMLRHAEEFESEMLKVGMEPDFDSDTPAGHLMTSLFQKPHDVITELFDLHEEEVQGNYVKQDGESSAFQITLYIFYPSDNDVDFSVASDDMFSLVNMAAMDKECADRLWTCFTEKNKKDAMWFRENYDICIGPAD